MPRIKGKPYVTNLLEFQRAFPDEQACLDYLELVRWPDGFTCPKCGVLDEPYYISTRPRVLVCRSCRAETSLTAGTITHRTKMSLQVWFWAAYLVTSQTPGMSALQFKRQLGLTRYETAFQMLHKLRVAMVRPSRSKIGEGEDVGGNLQRYPVELDETYVGGQTRGKGRGVTEKVVVVGAVEVRISEKEDLVDGEYKKRRYAGRLRMRLIPNRGKVALTKFATENIKTGTTVMTDDWVGYVDLWKWFDHEVVMADGEAEGMTKAELQAEKGEQIPLIHLVFSNLKTWIQGTHHGVRPNHLQAYLNEYVFRFNRRFYPMSGFHSVLGIAMEVKGSEYEDLYGDVWEHPNPEELWDFDSY
jgi:hypothetical protein